MNDIPISVISGIIGLLLAASFSAILFRRIKFPYTIGLVLVGILLFVLGDQIRMLKVMQHIHLTPNIILYILLPTLIFDAAIHIDSRLLLKNLTPVLTLAAPGLVLATAVTGLIIAWLTPLSIGSAMLFGALISATDPVAVIALFKELGAPRRLTMLVDGESLFNDATAIVAFNIVMGIVAGGAWSAGVLASSALNFVVVFAGGTLVGAIIGYLMILIIRMAGNDPLIEIAFSTVVAYAAFILANYYMELSGVMAAVGAGMVVNYYSSTRLTPEVRQYLHQFWGYASFVANSFIFLLLGLTETYLARDLGSIPRLLGYVAAAVFAIMASRALIVFLLVPLLNRLPRAEPIDWKNQAVMFWGGLRGALPIGLAGSLAWDFPGRSLIIQLTLGVVLFTLLVQGTTIKWLMTRLKMNKPTLVDRIARLTALEAAFQGGLHRIDAVEKRFWQPAEENLQKLREQYRAAIDSTMRELNETRNSPSNIDRVRRTTLWLQANAVERKANVLLFEQGFLSENTFREMDYRTEVRRGLILKGEIPPPHVPSNPVMLRVRVLTTSLFERLLPNAAWTQLRIVRDRVIKLELAGAVRMSGNAVLAELPRFAPLCGASESMTEECRSHYQSTAHQALEQTQALAREYPVIFHDLQDRIVRRAALIAERDTVAKLQQDNAIPGTVAQGILNDLETQLDKASVYKSPFQ